MIKHLYSLTFSLLSIVLTFGQTPKSISDSGLVVLQNNILEYSECNLLGSWVEGRGTQFRRGNQVKIIPFDTNEIILHLKTLEGLKSYSYKPFPNSSFDLAWVKNLDSPDSSVYSNLTYPLFRQYQRHYFIQKELPEFVVKGPHGETFTNQNLLGKITVLNFWYHGCIPCMAEIPDLNKLKNEFSGNQNIQFISFFLDSIKLDSNNNLMFETKAHSSFNSERYFHSDFVFKQFSNCESTNKKLLIGTYPTNMIIDQDGHVQLLKIGASTEDNTDLMEDLKFTIEQLLQKKTTE